MKQEEKVLIEKVSSFHKAFAPTKVKEINVEADIVLPDNDVDNFSRVVLCYKTDAPLFPVFIMEVGGVGSFGDKYSVFWFIPPIGPKAIVKIYKKYLRGVSKDGR